MHWYSSDTPMSGGDRIERYQHKVRHLLFLFEGAQAPEISVVYTAGRFYFNRQLIRNDKINFSPIVCRPKEEYGPHFENDAEVYYVSGKS